MASPFDEASPFTRTHGGAGNGFKRFGNEQTNPFQQSASGSSAFGTSETTAGSSIFGRSISTLHSVGRSSGQRGFSTPHENTPSPFAPASHVMSPSHTFGKASSFTNSFGFSTQTNSFGSTAVGASPCAQHTGNASILGGVAANPFKPTQATPLVGSSGFRTCLGKSSVSFESGHLKTCDIHCKKCATATFATNRELPMDLHFSSVGATSALSIPMSRYLSIRALCQNIDNCT